MHGNIARKQAIVSLKVLARGVGLKEDKLGAGPPRGGKLPQGLEV